jgi:hypothetical protein
MKELRDEGDGRTLLGDTTSGGAVMMHPMRFQCAEVWISTGVPCVYLYS